MNHQSENVSPRQLKAGRNWLWLALLCFGVPIVLSAAVLLYYISRERAAEAQLAERIERRFQAGLPYDNASASDYHAQHTSAELTDRWLEVLAILESEQFKQSTADVAPFDTKVESSVPRSKDARWPEGPVTRRFLNRWQGLQQRVQRLSRLQLEPDAAPVWMPIEFKSIETLLPHAQSLRQAARLLSLSGQVAVLEHDSAAVRRNVESLLGAARTLRGEPIDERPACTGGNPGRFVGRCSGGLLQIDCIASLKRAKHDDDQDGDTHREFNDGHPAARQFGGARESPRLSTNHRNLRCRNGRS